MNFPLGLKAVAVAAMLFSAICAPISAFAAPTISQKDKQDVLASIRKRLEAEAFVPNVQFDNWDKFIAKEQPAIDKAQNNSEFALAVQNALSDFGISHVYLLTPEDVAMREDNSVTGIGVQIFPEKDDVLIVKVYPKSSAAMGGLLPGDKIILVEGKSNDMVNRIRGKEGTTVHITVQHPDGTKTKYSLVRHSFNIAQPDSITFPNDNTAVVTIPTFDLSYSASTVDNIMKQADNKPNLVVDLRSNPGGSVLNMLHFLSLMMPPKTPIGTMVSQADVKAYQVKHPGKVDVTKVAASLPSDSHFVTTDMKSYYKGHVVVLVNQATGSAAEIASAALRDDANATIVGQKSAGAVLVSVIKSVADGFMLEFPIMDYVTISGIRLEGTGVTPDVLVPNPRIPYLTADSQLQKAIEVANSNPFPGSKRTQYSAASSGKSGA